MAKPKILVVEDSQMYIDAYKRALEDVCQVLSATDQLRAVELFEKHKGSIRLIIVDACVPGDNPNTHELTKRLRKDFTGPIIAASSMPLFAAEIVKAGATEQQDKLKVAARVKQLLGL